MEVTFATINTWKCDGDYIRRLKLLSERLNCYPIDLICCQEVFSSHDQSISTEKYLNNKLSLSSFYFPTRKKKRLVNGDQTLSYSGLCTFTNLPVLKEKKIILPTHIKDGERTAQIFHISKKNIKIAVVNTHLTHLKNESELKNYQIIEILQHVDIDDFDMVVICGDFNDTPESKTIKTLTKKYLFKSVLKNYPATHRNRCIDYIFYRSKLGVEILEAKLILNKVSEEGIFPSDHFGILATFKF